MLIVFLLAPSGASAVRLSAGAGFGASGQNGGGHDLAFLGVVASGFVRVAWTENWSIRSDLDWFRFFEGSMPYTSFPNATVLPPPKQDFEVLSANLGLQRQVRTLEGGFVRAAVGLYQVTARKTGVQKNLAGVMGGFGIGLGGSSVRVHFEGQFHFVVGDDPPMVLIPLQIVASY